MNDFHIEFGSDIDTKANIPFLSDNVNTNWLENSYLFRSARDALRYIAKCKKVEHSTRIFMPILCCDSMVLPFKQNGYQTIFYPLNSDYSIDINFIENNIQDNDIILVSNYFGLKNNDSIIFENNFFNNLKSNFLNITIIKDYTHTITDALFTDKTLDDFSIFSIRKWASFPDGGILWSKHNLNISYDKYDSTYFSLKKKAMDLKSIYLETKDINIKEEFLKLFKQADNILENSNEIIDMSDYSRNLICKLDLVKIYKTRLEHIEYLNNNTPFLQKLSSNTNCSGLYFPIYVENQKELQKYLAQNNIYCPIIWPIEEQNKTVSKFATNLISHMLAIPCDQRYTYQELDFIINHIKSKGIIEQKRTLITLSLFITF